jgi:hypothetical protein
MIENLFIWMKFGCTKTTTKLVSGCWKAIEKVFLQNLKVKDNHSPYLVQDVTRDFLPGCDIILDSKVNDRDYHKTMNINLFKRPTCSYFVFAEDKMCSC